MTTLDSPGESLVLYGKGGDTQVSGVDMAGGKDRCFLFVATVSSFGQIRVECARDAPRDPDKLGAIRFNPRPRYSDRLVGMALGTKRSAEVSRIRVPGPNTPVMSGEILLEDRLGNRVIVTKKWIERAMRTISNQREKRRS